MEMVEVTIDSIRVSLMNQQRIVILREGFTGCGNRTSSDLRSFQECDQNPGCAYVEG
jgi:hypothetical protein